MSEPGTRISKPGDFPNLAVYERDGTAGKIYTISFINLEFGGWKQTLTALAGLATLVGMVPAMIYFGKSGAAMGLHPIVGAILVLVLFFWLMHRMNQPWKTNRSIEIDGGEDRLRVLNNGRVKIERQFSNADNWTVDVHPDAEYKRMVRQEDGKKKLSQEERQHCLFGWFGAGGAEQVTLLTRAEWPNRLSLMEVQQAILWVKRQVEEPDEPLGDEKAIGIKPPLD